MIADLFSRLPPVERHFVCRVFGGCPRARLLAGETLLETDFGPVSLLVVERGVVAVVSEPPAGRRMVVVTAASGDLLAAPRRDQRLRALEEAIVITVGLEARRLLLGRPAVAEAIVGDLLARLREGEESLTNFGSVAHVERVRRKLLQLARRHGTQVDGGVQVDLPLTQALIAEMVGSARETVSGAVRTLERQGFLAREGGRYRLFAPAPTSPSVSKPV